MKRGHVILITGAVLLVAGITISAVWGMSFASSFFTNNTLVSKTTINAGQSVSAQNHVSELDRPISLAVGIDRTTTLPASTTTTTTTITNNNIRLRETITDPNGKVVSTNEFGNGFVTSFKPDVAGVYTVTITNLGQNPVSISGTFGYMPFIGNNGNPVDINTMMGGAAGQQGLGMIITGGVMATAGVITLIVGAIVTVADSRTKPTTSSTSTTTTSEGGITYRKD